MTNKLNNGLVKSVSLSPPTLQDNTADADRLINSLKQQLNTDDIKTDLYLIREVPELLRKWDYSAECVLIKERNRWNLIGLAEPKGNSVISGLAVDLGTTTVVVRLIDLSTGNTLKETSFNNPQISVGPDVLARIHYSEQDGGLEKLNSLIIGSLNETISALCSSLGMEKEDIYLLSVAGNTAMTHLFLDLNPYWIIREPYIPVVNNPGILRADELGIDVNRLARILVFPNIGSYFGGDLISGILYSGLNMSDDASILVDVGTNAEVVLGNNNWLIACAGAAGPALEGGVTKMGMMAGPGVIDQVEIDADTYEFRIHTIDDMKPRGICGSGLIDLAANLFLTGMIDIRGKLVKSKCGERYLRKEDLDHLVVVSGDMSSSGKDLTITQADLDSLVRSKAAMYTILKTITSSVGMDLSDISTFYVAGTFGSYIRPESAISIGMIPDLPLERFKVLGNSSLGGATMALLSSDAVEEIEKIRDSITYIELNVNQEFMQRFSAAKFLPHTDPTLFPSVKINV
ncbi:MAG: DUF4445 domain-containing protein [Desulfobacterales bacterium]|jgi:uncharacterized 2Fe-2S/4Fe-4S cluster protein (DUF4445 family)|nr:DUF4445 domain-containing protein [Desulfobacteraceae bacterium]MBT4365099.1 DUF4445 domain-containing protein [Desulfobacteraceae bacterium]MBT7085604.1 DUF4445 domain-containing protein [Desulfobacterales bacterium]MBT7697687.1 DUF4445 domain-containing protein [Desulfobacterales bacterium]